MPEMIEITGAVTGCTAYVNGKLATRDTAITLPEITPMMVDIKATGTLSVPVWALLDNMETSVTKSGVDAGFRALTQPKVNSYEFRWVQQTASGRNVGCKAFITGTPNKIPGIGVEVGSPSENEVTISTSRYVLYVDGVETIYIDKLAGKVVINGVDITAEINSML